MPQYNTPVLFLLFNRLDTAKQVFNAIRQAQPTHFYIACDGPRDNKEGEKEKVEEVRNYVLSHIDWECDVKTLFLERNVSCGPAVKQAIDWLFENEEMGIILEDDVLPDMSFFPYCEELLIRYKDDDRIGMISGNNHVGFPSIKDSYVFSKFKWTWGWATWRRAWKNMDLNLSFLESDYKNSIICNMGYDKHSYNHWIGNIDAINRHRVNTWDYHWFLSLSTQNQMCIFPRVNLVANIGFGNDATHCTGTVAEKYTRIEKLNFPLSHPQYVLPNYEFEKMYQNGMIPKITIWKKFIPSQIKQFIKKYLISNQ
jgi:hypothetical protein